jgi:hypothetical protein
MYTMLQSYRRFYSTPVTGVYGRTRLVLSKRSMDDFDKILTFATEKKLLVSTII